MQTFSKIFIIKVDVMTTVFCALVALVVLVQWKESESRVIDQKSPSFSSLFDALTDVLVGFWHL